MPKCDLIAAISALSCVFSSFNSCTAFINGTVNYENVTPLRPITNHLLSKYCNLHVLPIALKVIVPVPSPNSFHPGFVTITSIALP